MELFDDPDAEETIRHTKELVDKYLPEEGSADPGDSDELPLSDEEKEKHFEEWWESQVEGRIQNEEGRIQNEEGRTQNEEGRIQNEKGRKEHPDQGDGEIHWRGQLIYQFHA